MSTPPIIARGKYPKMDCGIVEGLHHHEDQVFIALDLVENGSGNNEGFVVRVLHQPVTHIQNVLLYWPLKSLLIPNETITSV